MKTKNSSSAPRDQTPGDIRYCNYFLEFPDGETWSDYTHIAGGLNAWIMNTAVWKRNPELAQKLLKKGQAHWKDTNGVTHRMVIAEKPCVQKWGTRRKQNLILSAK